MNHVTLMGRLTADPEIRYTQSGKAVASFTLAVDRRGEGVDFVPIVAWEKLAEIIGNNLTKGRRTLIEGRLQIRSYEHEGQKRKATEVVATNMYFCDSKSAQAESKADYESMGAQAFPEEEIPF